MELRKDPITRSWVAVSQPESPVASGGACLLCPGAVNDNDLLLRLPAEGHAQVRVFPHPQPLYRIEGEINRSPDGIYDRMNPVGAHEIIVETPEHVQSLARMKDEQILTVLKAYSARITDLKRDHRFKYVTVLRNSGVVAGQEFEHPHSQVVATPFVPRRILYELRSSREWFKEHERCVFCDILRQEEKKKKRIVDNQGDYVAFCPYASRVPFETWILPRPHNPRFEDPRPVADRRNLASLLGRTLRRIHQVALGYHMVLHTMPNTQAHKTSVAGHWKTVASDYHWHIEILPVVVNQPKSYMIKETYFNSLAPEQAAEQLRNVDAAL
jgi:UDPglucose--hexose-1-phosphate uridylyltransferase